jgi:hypothetical protein
MLCLQLEWAVEPGNNPLKGVKILTVLTYSMYTVRHAVALKWLPIVFMHLIQSQRSYDGYGKHEYG